MYIDCHTHVGIELGQYLCGDFPYGQQLIDLVEAGREHGIGRFMVFPMVTHFALNLRALREGRAEAGDALETVPYAFENRRLMREVYDLFPEHGKSALPLAMFDPARETAAQAAELCKLRENYRFYALKTQTTMLQSKVTALNEQGRVFLELAAEWDIPLLIHSSVLPADKWAQASDILDVAERNPQVRFCLAHSCRFDVACLRRVAELPNCWFDPSAHGIHCQLAVQDSPIVAPPARRFASDYRDPARVLADLAEGFGDKMMWGSDAPYYSYVGGVDGATLSLMSSYAEEARYFNDLPAGVKRRIGHDNTLRYLGLDNLP